MNQGTARIIASRRYYPNRFLNNQKLCIGYLDHRNKEEHEQERCYSTNHHHLSHYNRSSSSSNPTQHAHNIHTYATQTTSNNRSSTTTSSINSSSNSTACLKLCTKREYHVTSKSESVTIVAGLAVLAVGAKAGQVGLQAYEEWSKNRPAEEPEVGKQAKTEEAQTTDTATNKSTSTGAKKGTKKKENFFSKFFNAGVGSKYYEGGFDDKMTRREAALILGVRESASAKRIKDSHRKILILNHPDAGGSTYIATKVNEAKEMLLKGKDQVNEWTYCFGVKATLDLYNSSITQNMTASKTYVYIGLIL